MKDYYKQRIAHYYKIEKYGNVDIRESFFGGRTNNLTFNYECDPKSTQSIKYLDFTSLYPYVLSTKEYPIGHPRVITEFNNNNIENYFGFIKCKVLPPKSLYLPILPIRLIKSKKLVFPLCATCAEEMNQSNCKHSAEERMLVGTWTSMELKQAVKRGYLIKEILEILHYEEKRCDIFFEYIKTWLKVKTEASGRPPNCQTDDGINEFIDQFYEREGK